MAPSPFPKISARAWSTMRSRAAASPTVRLTADTVAALMDLANPKSAQENVVKPMRMLGLIDEDGVLTDRGHKWRIDESFGDACQQILDEIYPDELGTLIDEDGRPDRKMVKTWFQQQGLGDSNARLMTATYVMVAGKQPLGLPGTKPPMPMKNESPGIGRPRKSPEPHGTDKPLDGEPRESATAHAPPSRGPTIHLNIQIHIPADATPEQFDQIFSSMARHLYTT